MTAPSKRCSRCRTITPLTDFYPRVAARDGRRSECADCSRRDARRRHHANRDAARNRRYLTRYGITTSDVDTLRAEQHYRCAICGRHENQLPLGLTVDHCHWTGTVRALLCHSCNAGIGHFQDSPEILRTAIAYLARADELIAIADTERN